MKLHEPSIYIKWGIIIIVIGAIPKIGILGFCLVFFGITLELINRERRIQEHTQSPPESQPIPEINTTQKDQQ